jgi:hypothetical protein
VLFIVTYMIPGLSKMVIIAKQICRSKDCRKGMLCLYIFDFSTTVYFVFLLSTIGEAEY